MAIGPPYPDLCFMRGVHVTPNILKRVHEGRQAIFLAGHHLVPSPSVASPAPMGLFCPLNIQVLLEPVNLEVLWLWGWVGEFWYYLMGPWEACPLRSFLHCRHCGLGIIYLKRG